MAPFRSLLIKILLEQAIAAEEYAYRLYEGLLRSSPPAETARVLKLLAAAELEHRIRLVEFQKDPDTAAGRRTFPSAADRGDEPRPRENRAPADFRHLLVTALEKERRAVRRYGKLAEKSRLRTAREVFTYLMRQEMEHEEWILKLLEESE